MKILIIGGVAGGASTATRLRRFNAKHEIIMFEKGNDISYANCGIPYYLGDVIRDRKQLVLVTREDFKKKFNIDVRIASEVTQINPQTKTITVKDYTNNHTYTETYDKLVLSPGGNPIRPPIDGINDSRIFTLRNLEDMDKIKTFINTHKPQKAAVIGAGFIGLEMVENLHQIGIQVSIIELAGQVMNLMDYEMATFIHQHLQAKNIGLYLNDSVKGFQPELDGLKLILQSGRSIQVEMVILAIGVKPEIKLAQEAGLAIGSRGGIQVNAYLETSNPDIYALGDATEVTDCISGQKSLIPLANAANKQGRIVADNINGAKIEYKDTPGTAIAKVFDLAVAITGNSEKQLKKNSAIRYSKAYLSPSSHAGYYPEAYPMSLKLIYEMESGRILGAQIIGIEGVDKRIDVISSMLQNNHTVYDLARLELAYAPPYSSAKDPINLAGMIAVNQMEGKNKVLFWNEVPQYKEKQALFIDVRTKAEYDLDHIDGAINLPFEELAFNLKKIPDHQPVVVYCNYGKTAYFALRLLENEGYQNIYNLSGGFKLYKTTQLKQENIGIFDRIYIDKADNLHQLTAANGEITIVDACGMQCPGPILKLSEMIKQKNPGDIIEIYSTDPGFRNDIPVWCERTGHQLLTIESVDKKIKAKIQKSTPVQETISRQISSANDKTLIVFSNDLDRTLAAFIIANGAAAMGRKVTLFFTFWGLNILRKKNKVKTKKNIIEKMFALMMPRGSSKLKLSKMNMMGMGAMMIKSLMKVKNISSLESLIESAQKNGIRLIACQMSMDLMGIKKEELIDGVEIGGVASFLGAAEFADTNLFI